VTGPHPVGSAGLESGRGGVTSRGGVPGTSLAFAVTSFAIVAADPSILRCTA
jgi:hypothetical protein